MSKLRMILFAIAGVLLILFFFRNSIFVYLYYHYTLPSAAVTKVPLPDLDPQLEKRLTIYLQTHFQTPETYIIRQFKKHDIVFLGEMHRVRHDVLLVQRLIPLLYRQGIFNLGMEFACYRDQPVIDSLLRAPQYDPSVVNRILFNFLVTWGFQEYADIFKVAWQLNHSLPDSAPKFRIVGLNAFTDWSYVNSEADLHSKEIMAKVFPEGSGDAMMAKVILKEFVTPRRKALIYCGLHHAFTRYQQPIFNEQTHQFVQFITNRAGNLVFKEIGEKAMTICLHQPWFNAQGWAEPQVYPVNGIIDALMYKLGPEYYPVAFDTRGTPFGELPGETSFYHYGYSNFTLADLCDGYIFMKPLSQFKNVRHIHGFINKTNKELARQRLGNLQRKNSFLWKILSPAAVDTLFYSAANTEWLCSRFY